jgi:hypothetical protein
LKISILGTEYDISEKAAAEDLLLNTRDGYCDCSIKKIVIDEMEPEPDSKKDMAAVKRNIIRHELIHAFLYESGLDVNSKWGTDETLVDWIALQFPKMEKAFKEADCL